MMLGPIPARTIAAMYAEAPAWPTDEYNNAARKNNNPSSKMCDKSKGFLSKSFQFQNIVIPQIM